MMASGRQQVCSGWEERVPAREPPADDLIPDAADVAREFGARTFAYTCIGASWYGAPPGAGATDGDNTASDRDARRPVRSSDLPLCEGVLLAWPGKDAAKADAGRLAAVRQRAAAYERRQRELMRAAAMLKEAERRQAAQAAAQVQGAAADDDNPARAAFLEAQAAATREGWRQLEAEQRRIRKSVEAVRAALPRGGASATTQHQALEPDLLERWLRSSHKLWAQMRRNARAVSEGMPNVPLPGGSGSASGGGSGGREFQWGGDRAQEVGAARSGTERNEPDFLDLWQKAAIKLAKQMQRNAAGILRAAGLGDDGPGGRDSGPTGGGGWSPPGE